MRKVVRAKCVMTAPEKNDRPDSNRVVLDATPVLRRGKTTFICLEPEAPGRYRNWVRAGIGLMISTSFVLLAFIVAGELSNSDAIQAGVKDASELKQLVRFHSEIFKVDRHFNIANEKYGNARARARHRQNIIDLFDAANQYDEVLENLSSAANGISPPRLRNEMSRRWAGRALTILRGRLSHVRAENRRLVEVVDTGRFETAQSEVYGASTLTSEEQAVAIRRSYRALGLDLGEITKIRERVEGFKTPGTTGRKIGQ